MIISNETKIASKISSQCAFVNFPECNNPYVLTLFVFGILMIFPYSFFGMRILRRHRLSNVITNDHSLTFCFITIYADSVILILNISNLYWFNQENDFFLLKSARYFQVFASTLVFIDITKVLKTLNFRGSKILLFIGRITEIVIGVLVILHFISFYIPNSRFSEKVKNIQNYHVLTGLTLYTISLFLAVLSICFIFTDMGKFIEARRLQMIKIGIFFFPLIVIAHSNIYFWRQSIPFNSHLMVNFNNLKFYTETTRVNKKYELLNVAYICLWNPLCSYVFFLMMYLLSPNINETRDPKAEITSLIPLAL